ncbi:hypothetical protein NC652_024791 [Populus alba x Populus x berolinensis]|nr:hypothetical protein NC652_024791 [Populus alba x Populus x berolinensis]
MKKPNIGLPTIQTECSPYGNRQAPFASRQQLKHLEEKDPNNGSPENLSASTKWKICIIVVSKSSSRSLAKKRILIIKSEPIIPSQEQDPPARVPRGGNAARCGKTVSALDPTQTSRQKTHQQSR